VRLRVCLLLIMSLSACVRSPVPSNLAPGMPFPIDTVADCQTLERIESRGSGPSPNMAPSLWRIQACPGRAGIALAQVLVSHRLTNDTSILEAATSLGHYLHDASLYLAASRIAADTGAAEWARVAALRDLLWTKAPGHHMTLEQMLGPPACPRGHYCTSSYTGHYFCGCGYGTTPPFPAYGAPLPRGYRLAIHSLATRLASDANAPLIVRQAAEIVVLQRPDGELGER
jgi:hypothetical protein